MPSAELSPESITSPFTNLWGALFKGGTYSLKTFYEIKNTIMRYDDRTDYVNLGYWDGDEKANPSARLVEETAVQLKLTPDDILLNIGSGLGQPDIDIMQRFSPERIIGVNSSSAQVTYANAKFSALKLADRIKHRVADARSLDDDLAHEGITSVISVEALAEIPDVAAVFQKCYELLPPGGRIGFCDGIRIDQAKGGPLKRLMGQLLFKLVTVLYNDHMRPAGDYISFLEKSGFTDVRYESIGDKVYPPLYRHAKNRFPMLRSKKFPLFMRWITHLNFVSMYVLHARGQLDYAIFSAQKPTP